MTQTLPINELDFFRYKEQLKAYLKGQDRFKDYNFEGSNMSILLDVLAYNTYQNNFYNNMVVSEMFLDSALRETSVISHAKTLNYLPRSRVSATTQVSFTLGGVPATVPFIVIPEKTKIVANSDRSRTYNFYTDQTHTVFPDERGIYRADCLPVFEGRYVNEFYTITGDLDQRLPINNEHVDVKSVRVFVIDSATSLEEEYFYSANIFGVSVDDKAFYLQNSFNRYEIYFGRNAFGIQPDQNAKVRVEYRVSSGAESNGAQNFVITDTIQGYSIGPIAVTGPAEGGAEREDIDSIKFFAPKSIQVQERAITESDYEILIKNNFPEIQAVSVIGGEKLDPPRFGRVFVYLDTFNSEGASKNTKNKILEFIKNKTPLGINPVVESANFSYIGVDSLITYDTTKSRKTENDIRKSVLNSILAYSDASLNKFGVPLRFSRFVKSIDESDPNIVSNQTKIRIIQEMIPSLVRPNTFELHFHNELIPIADYALRSLQSQVPNHPVVPKLESERVDRYPTVSSSRFRFNNATVYIRDDGFGSLQLVRNMADRDVIVRRNVGTVDYKTGYVFVNNLALQSFTGSALKFYADVKSADIHISKDMISVIRQEDISISVRSVL